MRELLATKSLCAFGNQERTVEHKFVIEREKLFPVRLCPAGK